MYKKRVCDEQQLRQPAPPSIATSTMGEEFRTFKNSFDKYGACKACTSPRLFHASRHGRRSPHRLAGSLRSDDNTRWQHTFSGS